LNDPETLRQYNALIALEKEVQFNSILSFTLQRDNTDDIFSPGRGFVHSITLEESGLLPLLLKDLQPGVPFTQFYRVILNGRWFNDLSRNRSSILGLRMKAGIEAKYGESRSDTSRVIPQTHRFYAGGGGSVRGWPSRGLIAGGTPELGGNLIVEGSSELRIHPFGGDRESIFYNIWLVTFLDFGSVWTQAADFRFEQVAMATGLGFRYDTFFGPFRIDFGIRVYDPGNPDPGKRWITEKKFFSETLSEGALHFGIGHAF
jgi:outer membrane protein assembly factor BamA